MKSTKSVANGTLQLFHFPKYLVAADGNVVTVFGSDLNWKVLTQFSVYEFVKSPTVVEIFGVNIDEEETVRTPSKKLKLAEDTTQNVSTNQKQQKLMMCIGNGVGSLVFVNILGAKKVVDVKVDSQNGQISSPVSCLYSNSKRLYFGHEDGHAGFVEIPHGKKCKVKRQSWKWHDSKVSCIAASLHDSFLATSLALDIFIWDLTSKKVLKQLKPFTSPPSRLIWVPKLASEKNGKKFEFLVCASNSSRTLYCVDVDKGGATNFQLSSNFAQVSATSKYALDSVQYLCSCNVDGLLQMFPIVVKGKTAKASFSVKVEDISNKSIIPILASHVLSASLVIVYGTYPEFVCVEEIAFKSLATRTEIVLERQDPRYLTASVVKPASLVVNADKKKTRKSLVNAESCHVSAPKEPSLMELLNQITGSSERDLDQVEGKKLKSGTNVMRTEGKSKALLLIQCLSSNDVKKLSELLQIRSCALIRETVTHLTGAQVFSLLTRMFTIFEGGSNPVMYVWFRELLNVHFEYLQGCKSLKPHFQRIRLVVNKENHVVEQLRSLRAKLESTLLQERRDSPFTDTFDEPSNSFVDVEEEEEAALNDSLTRVSHSPKKAHSHERNLNTSLTSSVFSLASSRSSTPRSAQITSAFKPEKEENSSCSESSELEEDVL